MPDWLKLVETRLAKLALRSPQWDEVIAEIAAHLEDTCDELQRNGVTAEEAERRTLATIPDWEDLRRQLQAAKEEISMQDRVRQFWVPTIITYALSMSLLAILQRLGLQPWFLQLSETGGYLVYLPWLLALPFLGALGAYLSLRAGGSRRSALSVSAFPIIPYLAFFALGLPLSMVIDSQVAHNIQAAAFVSFVFSWVLVPGAALLLGGLLLCAIVGRALTFRQVASH